MTPTTPARSPSRVAALTWAAAVLLVATLPLTVVWRNAPPVTASATALLLLASCLAAGRGDDLVRALRGGAASALGLTLLAGLAYMAASLAWTRSPARGLGHLDDVVLTVAIVALMIAAVRLLRRGRLDTLLPIGLALAATALVVNTTFDGALNAALGRWQWAPYYNRAALGVVLFLPLAVALAWRARHRAVALGLTLLVLAAVMTSASEAAKLALVAMLASAPATLAWPRSTHRLVGLAMVAVIAITPWTVGHANALVPQVLHDRFGYLTIGVRGDIWREFAALYRERPILGLGLEGSHFVGEAPETAALEDRQRELLAVMHPHSTPLQVWVELGLVGAVLLVLLVAVAWRRIEASAGWLLPWATQAGLGTFAIAAVSPGAWQAWWLCLVGLLVVAFTMVRVGPEVDVPPATGTNARA